jgi:hypothetical protein
VNITRIAQPRKLGQPWVREIVPGVFRVGTTFLGCYAVEDAGAYTFIDVGLPLGHPGNLGGHETWEDARSWRHRRSIRMSCANAR